MTAAETALHKSAAALEHASHAWQKLIEQGRVPMLTDAWPPSTDDTVMFSAEYHIAAMIEYLKQAHDVLSDEVEPVEDH